MVLYEHILNSGIWPAVIVLFLFAFGLVLSVSLVVFFVSLTCVAPAYEVSSKCVEDSAVQCS